jgi:predicted acetyltransferase
MKGSSLFAVAEFFVMKKYRKLGVGQHVSTELFNKFSGIWKVSQMETNLPAQSFWRKTIERYTNNNYQEIREDDWEGPIHTFSTVTRWPLNGKR